MAGFFVMDHLLNGLTDLHQHLSFSSTPHFLWELAHEQGIKLMEKDYWKFIDAITVKKTTTQKQYHHLFDVVQRIQSSPYAVEKAVHHAISYSYRKANVTTIEIRFNPMRRNKGGEHDLDKIILAACVGIKKASLEYPVKAGLVIETDRRFEDEYNAILIDKAIAFKSFGIVGIDLSGPENKNFRLNKIISYYQKARRAGLGLTFHTGETSSISEMEEVVRKIKPDRIGHGVKAKMDKKLMDILADKKIVLEICPSSNLALQILKDWDEVEETITKFKENGILFTINSDCPTMIDINVKKELTSLLDRKILSVDDVKKIKKIAREATFINS
jgi:adenosine deaminase